MTGIPDEAVNAFIGGWMTVPHSSTFGEHARAGLAAALPHLAAALRASQPDRGSSDGASEGRSRGSVALSGLQGHSAPTPNPQCTARTDCPACRCVLNAGHSGDHDAHCQGTRTLEEDRPLTAADEAQVDEMLRRASALETLTEACIFGLMIAGELHRCVRPVRHDGLHRTAAGREWTDPADNPGDLDDIDGPF